jgi:hypothetical protein
MSDLDVLARDLAELPSDRPIQLVLSDDGLTLIGYLVLAVIVEALNPAARLSCCTSSVRRPTGHPPQI